MSAKLSFEVSPNQFIIFPSEFLQLSFVLSDMMTDTNELLVQIGKGNIINVPGQFIMFPSSLLQLSYELFDMLKDINKSIVQVGEDNIISVPLPDEGKYYDKELLDILYLWFSFYTTGYVDETGQTKPPLEIPEKYKYENRKMLSNEEDERRIRLKEADMLEEKAADEIREEERNKLEENVNEIREKEKNKLEKEYLDIPDPVMRFFDQITATKEEKIKFIKFANSVADRWDIRLLINHIIGYIHLKTSKLTGKHLRLQGWLLPEPDRPPQAWQAIYNMGKEDESIVCDPSYEILSQRVTTEAKIVPLWVECDPITKTINNNKLLYDPTTEDPLPPNHIPDWPYPS